MTKFTDNLWSDIAAEHGPAIERAERPAAGRTRHPGLIAGGTLALAVGGTALGLGLTSTGGAPAGGTSAGTTQVRTAAFSITKSSDGSVLLHINRYSSIVTINNKLASMGIREGVSIEMGTGPATVKGPVSCTREPGVSGPAIKVLVGSNGTEVNGPGTTGGNTGEGTFHLMSCAITPSNADGGTGSGG